MSKIKVNRNDEVHTLALGNLTYELITSINVWLSKYFQVDVSLIY